MWVMEEISLALDSSYWRSNLKFCFVKVWSWAVGRLLPLLLDCPNPAGAVVANLALRAA